MSVAILQQLRFQVDTYEQENGARVVMPLKSLKKSLRGKLTNQPHSPTERRNLYV